MVHTITKPCIIVDIKTLSKRGIIGLPHKSVGTLMRSIYMEMKPVFVSAIPGTYVLETCIS